MKRGRLWNPSLQLFPLHLFNLLQQELHQSFVQVVAAEAGVAVGGEDLEDAGVQFENREVEGAAAEVIHGDFGMLLEAVETVGKGGGGGFVDDALDGEAGQLPCPLRRVALGVVEVGGDGDDGASDGFAKVGFSGVLQLLEDFSRDFLRREVAAVNRDCHWPRALAAHGIGHEHLLARDLRTAPAHEAFHGIDRAGRVEDAHAVGGVTDDRGGVGCGEVDDAGAEAVPVGVGDDVGDARVHGRDERVGSAEVEADDFRHTGGSCF